MKTKLELIKNYPIEALKNWGEYFGYPESICKDMLDIVDCDWQDTKIGVLDDFGFRMINYLMNVKKVPLQNIYFLVSEEDEAKVELMRKWYSNFVENEILQIYNIGNMSFDLIIANPPFGDGNKGTLPRKIIKAVKNCTKESIWLMPTTHFQYDNMFKEIASFKRFSKIESQNIFEGVSCPPLSIVRFDGKVHNLFSDKLDYSLPRTPLVNAFRQYNIIHPSCCVVRSHFVNHSNLGIKDEKSPSSFDPETFKLYNQDFYERTLVFGMYWISNGIHADEGNAIDNFWNYKLDNYEDFQAKVKELDAHPDLHAATFKSKQEKQNCEKYRHGKLYSKLLSEFDNGGSIEYIRLCIPNLDWSHSWTDKEILKEIGLPEDFLEER